MRKPHQRLGKLKAEVTGTTLAAALASDTPTDMTSSELLARIDANSDSIVQQAAIQRRLSAQVQQMAAALPTAAGKDGLNGANGKDGAAGKDGLNGTNGRDGIDGVAGKDGLNGANGKDGAAGKDGLNGTNGKDGAAGKDGLNGTNGTNGKDGAAGKDGLNGTNGKDGAAGKDGLNGTNGKDGADLTNPRFRSVRMSTPVMPLAATVTIPVTWATPFADANYTINQPCFVGAALAKLKPAVTAWTAAGCTVTVENILGINLAVGAGTLHISAIHD